MIRFCLLLLFAAGLAQAANADVIREMRLVTSSPQGLGEGFENEHAAQPVKKFFLQGQENSRVTGAWLVQADGKVSEVHTKEGVEGLYVDYRAKWGDGPQHGANQLYVMTQKVEEGIKEVYVAKRISIHHNCSWGHMYKYDDQRHQLKNLEQVPLDIIPRPLWDGNFHIGTQAGAEIELQVLYQGKPLAMALVSITTQRGWSKTLTTDAQGMVRVQLIRDDYPKNWEAFDPRKHSRIYFTAQLEMPEAGHLDGQAYHKTRYQITLPWRYNPNRLDYVSYFAGLGLVLFFLVLFGTGFFLHRHKKRIRLGELSFHE